MRVGIGIGIAIAIGIGIGIARADKGGPSELFLDGKAGKLQAFLWKPDGAGPFPAIVYNHGSEQQPTAATASEIGPFFVAHGYVVLFPIRRGNGKSEGRYWRDRAGAAPDFQRGAVDALVEENDDVATAVAWLRAQPFVDGKRIAVAGCSFGGIETLLAAERIAGIAAAVDFAGGAMSWDGSAPIRERMIQAAERARVPVFFVQAENDFNTAPSRVSRRRCARRASPSACASSRRTGRRTATATPASAATAPPSGDPTCSSSCARRP